MDTNTTQACGTNANGFRFVRRGCVFCWVHPAEINPEDQDCSEMSDDEFEACVREYSEE